MSNEQWHTCEARCSNNFQSHAHISAASFKFEIKIAYNGDHSIDGLVFFVFLFLHVNLSLNSNLVCSIQTRYIDGHWEMMMSLCLMCSTGIITVIRRGKSQGVHRERQSKSTYNVIPIVMLLQVKTWLGIYIHPQPRIYHWQWSNTKPNDYNKEVIYQFGVKPNFRNRNDFPRLAFFWITQCLFILYHTIS